MEKTAEALGKERFQRIQDAYDLKQPDRVPITLNLGYMLSRLEGVTNQYLDENPDAAQEALEKWAMYYQPDEISAGAMINPFPSLALGDRTTRFLGHGIPADRPFQFAEREYMKAEDYDAFLDDPTDYAIRHYLPRAYAELEPLAMLPRLSIVLEGYPAWSRLAILSSPEMLQVAKALHKAAEETIKGVERMIANGGRMAALGYLQGRVFAGVCLAPFDFMGDTLRGTRGIMRDMYQRPDQLKAGMEIGAKIMLEDVIASASLTGGKTVFIPLHKGSDGFMSLEQFEEFYWPPLKKMMLDLVDAGLTPVPFYEGVWDQRLRYLAELPKGKTRGMFERSDMGKVKEALGDVMCIQGGFPVSLLQGGTPEQVREHTKWMCEVVGEGGGFVMGASTAMDYCDKDLVKVWVDATKEYGVY